MTHDRSLAGELAIEEFTQAKATGVCDPPRELLVEHVLKEMLTGAVVDQAALGHGPAHGLHHLRDKQTLEFLGELAQAGLRAVVAQAALRLYGRNSHGFHAPLTGCRTERITAAPARHKAPLLP